MAREWRTNMAAEDFQSMSIVDLLRLIKTKVEVMDEGHATVDTFDEAVTLLRDNAKVMVASMVVIQKLVLQVQHLRTHLTEEGGMTRDN